MNREPTDPQFHPLDVPLPSHLALNNPFCYEPDALTLAAVRELQRHLSNPQSVTPSGKMWGVLVVEYNGEVGFLCAYSGQIDGSEGSSGCPPVFDYLQPDGYFKTHEAEITAINHEIERMEHDGQYLRLRQQLAEVSDAATRKITRRREAMVAAKYARDRRRAEGLVSEDERKAMIRQSQYLKAEVHRAKVFYRQKIEAIENQLRSTADTIAALRRRRKLMSDHLQSWLFSQFVLLNARGERKNMVEIFRTSGEVTIPSGAGECCEPKLLQYAYLHGMCPLRIASFWWGDTDDERSTPNAQRTTFHVPRSFYPACSGRCKPILSWMLQGLDVDPNPLEADTGQELRIVYDDEWLTVVDKPAGMLSVPGKGNRESVVSILADRWRTRRSTFNVFVVHRLDMATSGLMIVAKDPVTQRRLQRDFEQRKVKKEYVAVVETSSAPLRSEWSGEVSLPLRPDPLDRPRQVVDFEHGKEALTLCRVLSAGNGEALLLLTPKTGRTHQLRVHCASPLGLNAPIKGDTLYGKPADRMYLHACRITFVHPQTGKQMTFYSQPGF